MTRLKGFHHTQKTKDKISKSLKGHPIYKSPIRSRNISLAKKGKPSPNKGKRCPWSRANILKANVLKKGKTYQEIYGERALGELRKRRKSILLYWSTRRKKEKRPKHERWQYRNWREKVYRRDNWTCRLCGIRTKVGLGKSVYLEAHHIKDFATYPQLRYRVINGLTLCKNCHKIIHKIQKWNNQNTIQLGFKKGKTQ